MTPREREALRPLIAQIAEVRKLLAGAEPAALRDAEARHPGHDLQALAMRGAYEVGALRGHIAYAEERLASVLAKVPAALKGGSHG